LLRAHPNILCAQTTFTKKVFEKEAVNEYIKEEINKERIFLTTSLSLLS